MKQIKCKSGDELELFVEGEKYVIRPEGNGILIINHVDPGHAGTTYDGCEVLHHDSSAMLCPRPRLPNRISISV